MGVLDDAGSPTTVRWLLREGLVDELNLLVHPIAVGEGLARNARDTTLAFVSRAPQADIERWKARMGWEIPWYTITDDFDADFGVDEWHGTNAFFRDGDRISGDEAMGSTWRYLDLTALGRQEAWEDSPEGYPQTPPYQWWNLHDEYGDAT